MLKKEIEKIANGLEHKLLKITNAHDYITAKYIKLEDKYRTAKIEKEAAEGKKEIYKTSVKVVRWVIIVQSILIAILIAMLIIK